MKQTGGSVGAFIADITPAARQRDANTLAALLQEVSGRAPELWGTIIGFGSCHYRYPTGNEGDSPIICFAPRKTASTVYLLDGVSAHAEALTRIGPHTTGAGCLYLKNLDDNDLDVLRGILQRSLAWADAGGNDQIELTITQ